MNPLRLQDISLYELATNAEAVPLLQVSPTIFKSMVATLIDVVIERQIKATLWLKLPRGEAWHSEFDRFSAASAQSVYVLGDKPPTAQSIVSLDLEMRLRREYFLLVQSPQFTALVLANRLRTSRLPAELPDSGEEELERKHPLTAIATCDRAVIDRVVGGLAQMIAGTEAEADLQTVSESIDPAIVSDWLAKQIQRQEEIWHSSMISRRQAEAVAQLRQENTTLLKSLRHKDDFLKTLGQELRTPLTTMKTALSLLSSPTLKPPQRQRYMHMLTQAIDRQTSVITSVLDLVQLEDVTDQPPQPLRLADVVPGVVSTYQPLAQEKGVMLAYTIPEELPPVACLNPWLRQIVINLLHNGIKFTAAGGQVWVKARQQEEFIELEVSDTGVGIPPTDLHRIFDRFYSVRQSSEDSGAGLGLSIVQQLIDRCGGSISVKSKPAEGSAFKVLLPIYAASPTA
ncbi:MAG: histidine kinase [Leptolyngbyaceae cyanobacterium SM1_3_5]|nr:histidine kinase [Leptolyngbyaceae cyanobacterium SM1_3_5]